MKKIQYIFIYVITIILSACNVHEWPEIPDKVSFNLKLSYETEMTKWEHLYDDAKVIEQGFGDTYDNYREYGIIRYIVRAYPVTAKNRTIQDYAYEFVFTKDITDGYDHQVMLELAPGNYNIMVWSDLVSKSSDSPFYNADNFSEIVLQGNHKGNDDSRDAFRGSNNISLVADFVEHEPETLNVIMQRPLAKYEFLATDLQEFIDKEMEFLAKEAETRGDTSPTRVNTDDYKVVLYYSGYMPNAYNMNTDKPVDSVMGVQFESKINVLSSNEALLGFDYVFVNGKKSAVTVQIGLYDKEDRQLALSEPIFIPLQRSLHTILKGSFLMQQASGGITINPEFDGNHNIIIE